MNNLLREFIDPIYVYRFSHGPHIVQSPEAARASGINCVSLAHLALRELVDYRLPADLLCTEMYFDRQHFRPLADNETPRLGDIGWFGVAQPKIDPAEFVPIYAGSNLINWSDFPINHLAVHLGEQDDRGDPLLLHASFETGTTSVWPEREFANYARYARSYGTSRLLAAETLLLEPVAISA